MNKSPVNDRNLGFQPTSINNSIRFIVKRFGHDETSIPAGPCSGHSARHGRKSNNKLSEAVNWPTEASASPTPGATPRNERVRCLSSSLHNLEGLFSFRVR